MKQHRDLRRPLERQYGQGSPELNQAYAGYPYMEQIQRYRVLEQRTHETAEEAKSLQIEPRLRLSLMTWLEAMEQAYGEIEEAFRYEESNGYLSAKPRWDQQRNGTYRRSSQARQIVHRAFQH